MRPTARECDVEEYEPPEWWTRLADHMCHEYDRLTATLQYGRSSRRLRRDGQVAAAADRLERAIGRLYIRDEMDPEGHRLNVEQWDQFYPEAEAWFVGLAIAITEADALADDLSQLADASIRSTRLSELLPAEPAVHPPSVRSEPALAHAPPPRVALDVMAAAA